MSTRIWAKILKNHKIKQDLLYTSPDEIGADNFLTHVSEICHTLDIPTPIITSVNVNNFEEFNNTRFRSRDFIEGVNFDFFVLENAAETKKDTEIFRPKLYNGE